MMKYTKELLEKLVKESNSITEVAKKLGRRTDGYSFTYLSNLIKSYKIDISHYKGRGWNKGLVSKRKLSCDEILVNDCTIRTKVLKLRRALIESGIEHKCACCGNNGIWNKVKLVLHVDHIDGNPLNNLKENLRFLCPNCHSQTETFGSKRLKKAKIRKKVARKTKIQWPSREDLQKMLWEEPTSSIAKKLGVSDNAITKRCKKLDIVKPGLGYWQKLESSKNKVD